MRHVQALAVKYLITGVLLALVLPMLANATVGQAMVVAALVTAVNYLVGDLIILPSFGNMIAAAADAGLTGVLVWASQLLVTGFIATFSAIMVAAGLVGLAEWFFHRYLRAVGVVPLP
jgi:hypothetical protein